VQLAWDFPDGRPSCILKPSKRLGFPAYRPGRGEEPGLLLKSWRQRKLVPADLSTYASRLHYVLELDGSTVRSDYALLLGVAGYATAREAASRLLDALAEQARRIRAHDAGDPRR